MNTSNNDNLKLLDTDPVQISPISEDAKGEPQPVETELTGAIPQAAPLEYLTMANVRDAIGGVTWLWEQWIPEKCLTIVAAHPGVGKSAFVLGSIVKAVTQGSPFLDGSEPTRNGKVIWCDTESAHDGNVDRISDWGIDPDLILIPGSDVCHSFQADNGEDVARLCELSRQQDIQLIVIDSLRGTHSKDENSSQHVAKVMEKLSEVASTLQIAVILIHHCRKSQGDQVNDKPVLRGSSAIEALARSIIMLEKIDSGTTKFVGVSSSKNNFSMPADDLGFQITDTGIVASAIPGKTVTLNKNQKAKQFLQEQLANGPKKSTDLEESATKQGIKKKTLDRATKELGLIKDKEMDGWYTSLPKIFVDDVKQISGEEKEDSH